MSNQYVPYITDNEEVKELILEVWEHKDEGMHAWKQVTEGYVTIESENDGDEDFILVQIVDKIDFLGYPFGNVYGFDILYEDEIEKLKTTA